MRRSSKRLKMMEQAESESEDGESSASGSNSRSRSASRSLPPTKTSSRLAKPAPGQLAEPDDEDEEEEEDEEEGSDVVRVESGGGTPASSGALDGGLSVLAAAGSQNGIIENARSPQPGISPRISDGTQINQDAEETKAAPIRRPAQSNFTSSRPTGTWAFVNKEELQKRVTRIASEGSMRALKSDTLDVLSLAVQQRLRGLLSDAVVARNHRISSHHQRQPPMHLNRPDEFIEGNYPMWDQVVHDDAAKVLTAIAHVERLSERQARRNRSMRDQQEEAEEQQAKEQAAMDAENAGDTPNADGETKKVRKPKPSAMREARNIDAATQSKLSKATASSALGLKKYGWMNAGAALASSSGRSTPTTSKRKNPDASAMDVDEEPATATIGASAEPNIDSEPTVLWRDAMFALERERGTGAGPSSGAATIYKSYLFKRKPA